MKRVYWADNELHIDLRGLPPPEPMVEIVRLIERDDTKSPIYAHLDRDPIYLYPELSERDWQGEVVSEEAGNIVVRLTRVEP